MVFRGICLLYLLAIFQTTYLHCRRTITDNERKENKSLMTANDVITQRKNADSFSCLYHRNFSMTILSLLRPHRVHIRKQQGLFFFLLLLSLSSSFKNRTPAIGELYLYQETMSPFISMLFIIFLSLLKSLSVTWDCVDSCISLKLITLGCFRGKLVNIVLSAETHHFVSF